MPGSWFLRERVPIFKGVRKPDFREEDMVIC